MKKAWREVELLGIREGIIYEAVVTTCDKQGLSNVAPMGFTYENRSIALRPFKDTKTYRNLVEREICSLNLCNDGRVFFLAIFGELVGNQLSVERADDWYHLQGAGACLDLRIMEMEELSPERVLVRCGIERITFYKTDVARIAFTRADAALVEATIHATRVLAFLDKGYTEKIKELMELIVYYREVIGRVAPKTEYETYMEVLLKYLKRKIKESRENVQFLDWF